MPSPTELSLRLLRRRGYLVDLCERWIPHTTPPIRADLFRAFDIVGLHQDAAGVLGVQTTSLGCLSARVKKLRELPAVARWLKCGNAVALHGWTQRGDGWRVKIVELRAEDMMPIVVECPRRRRPNRHYQGELW